MKNNLIKYLCGFAACMLVYSCAVEEPERSTVTNVETFNVASVESSSLTVAEGDGGTHTVGFTLDPNITFDGVTNIRIGAGTTATADVDFHLNDTEVAVGPVSESYSFSFDIFPDVLLEGDETIVFELSTAVEPFFRDEEVMTVTVNITDFITNDTYLTFDWCVPFVFDGLDYNACSFVDLDVYVLDMDGVDQGIYQAATGDTPETFVVDDTFADGDYFLAAAMWDNATLKGLLDPQIEYTLTTTAYRQGKIDATFVSADNFLSNDGDQQVDGSEVFYPVALLTVAGGVHTLTSADGMILGSGFSVPNKSEIK